MAMFGLFAEGFPVWWALLVLALILLWRYGTSTFNTWRDVGIPGPRPWPFVGTVLPFFLTNPHTYSKYLMEKYGSVVGVFSGRTPALEVTDPAMIKEIMIKSHSHFVDRLDFSDISSIRSYVIRMILVRLSGDHWRHVRHHITPVFTSGKLRQMTGHINKSAQTLVQHLSKITADSGKENIEPKKYFGNFTMDVIAGTAFGLDLDSQRNPGNPFVANARRFMNSISFNLTLVAFFPAIGKLFKLFGQDVAPKSVVSFFSDIMQKSLQLRQEDDSHRDFLHSMKKLQVPDLAEGADHSGNPDAVYGGGVWYSKKGLTTEEVYAQAMLFFVAGYETTSTALSYVAYCLALNPDCQKSVIEEIDALWSAKKDDDLTYEEVAAMPYLDKFISETLRLYNPATRLARLCNEDIVINGICIRKGTNVTMPIYAIHRNPKFWPNPETFDPNRFDPEEKAKRDPYTYVPFGHGPRNCIGMRLALLEVKMGICHVLRKFEFHASDQTQRELKLQVGFVLTPQKAIMVTLKARGQE